MEYQFKGINTALQTLCREILDKGVWRETRGFKCLEFPEPVLIEITDPTSRWCTIKERKWVKTLPYVESLHIALGRNDLAMKEAYVPNLKNFSDDGKFIRADYGSRIRRYTGIAEDYKNDRHSSETSFTPTTVDQYKFIEQIFKKDSHTRQAGITIHDPGKDAFDLQGNLKQSKDFPCQRLYQLMQSVDGKLNWTTFVRSNDLQHGFAAVNFFNHSFMQEYWSSILSMPIGTHFHFANNLHVYDYHLDMVKSIAEASDYIDGSYEYVKTFKTLEEFDILLKKLEDLEEDLRVKQYDSGFRFEDPFFDDWHNIFIWKWMKKDYKFHNHIITNIIV